MNKCSINLNKNADWRGKGNTISGGNQQKSGDSNVLKRKMFYNKNTRHILDKPPIDGVI